MTRHYLWLYGTSAHDKKPASWWSAGSFSSLKDAEEAADEYLIRGKVSPPYAFSRTRITTINERPTD